LSSVRHLRVQESDAAFLLQTLARLWIEGIPIDWRRYHGAEVQQKVPLPTYPFERQRYWIDPPEAAQAPVRRQPR
jgi:acyl transferase domain-containing protein